jgi:LuxR family maltose regulon positive regulatory protein
MPARQAELHGAARASPPGASAQRRRIRAAKLSPPPLRPGIVDRPVLLELITSASEAPVVLVSAPAGYGKTTLLALWRSRDVRPFGWLSLDATDNDPAELVAGVLAALEPIVDLGDAMADLPSLVDACIESDSRFVLVLDDLHLVTDRRCHTLLGYLGERLPAGCQIALATRTDPPLPIASWRAHGRLAEVRVAELSLAVAEARAVLAAAGARLPDHQVAQLVERTEGWPAAIYLAALSIRGRPHARDFVDRFAGTSRHVADFLSEDVLARQPDDVIAFLLRTCVLDELTAARCNALTGRADADEMLRALERSNLFVVPLDEERRAYRYHHLFAQYLRAELARREPELVPVLRRRAVRRRQPSRGLSDAEHRILRLLATDLSLREIGRELYLSPNTVKTHTRAIYRKLGVSSRTEAVKAGSPRRGSPG